MTDLGRHYEVHVPRLPRPRLAVAVVFLGIGAAGAATLYSHKFTALYCGSGSESRPQLCSWPGTMSFTPSWVFPTVLVLCVLGVAGAVGCLTGRPRVATAAATLGITFGAAVVIYAHSYRGGFMWCSYRAIPPRGNTFFVPACDVLHGRYTWASWGSGTALAIALLGVVLAAGVTPARRRSSRVGSG